MFSFEGERRRCVAMPLGGVGTGNLAICGDGSLRQWQIHNKVNHVGYVPHSFFAVRWVENHRPIAKLLQTDEFWSEEGFEAPPTSSDHYVPPEMIRTLGDLPIVEGTSFRGCYPVGEIHYDLGTPDLELILKAWNPLVPGNSEDSSWPVAVFEFTVANKSPEKRQVQLLATLQNAVGWDGATLIHGNEHAGYGGNRNRAAASDGHLRVDLTNPSLADDHPSQGAMALVALGQNLTAQPEWDDLEQLWNDWTGAGRFKQSSERGASRSGRTWNAAVTASVSLEPGEEKTATFLYAWHFPNRYVDWGQWDNVVPAKKSRFYLGNRYCHRGLPSEWLHSFLERLPELSEATMKYSGRFDDSPVSEALSSTVANLRTNVCLWTEDGRFYGFEGGHGASTWEGVHAVGGCCAMNCTHVWNYEQGLAELWPDLFRSMRETDWLVNLSPKGQLPHRVTLPVYVKKLWDVPIGGPENPALDGLFSGVLKTYQAAIASPFSNIPHLPGRATGAGEEGSEWLGSVWPQVKQAMAWVMTHADTDGDGVLKGEQPNTYDIHLYGPNTFIGSQYLAALRAMEEMAKLMGEDSGAYRERFELGSQGYDKTCFNGEYYVQRVPSDCDKPYQFADGCAADQLLGQWWAHHLGLGYVLPPEHVKSACRSIFRRNFRRSFAGFKQDPRVFASDHDRGLLVCTYEQGQRREVPLLYSDEVWTGIEYAVASLFFHEGMAEEANEIVRAVRARYDGRERNPFNEVECGDHYIRALSAWSLPKSAAN